MLFTYVQKTYYFNCFVHLRHWMDLNSVLVLQYSSYSEKGIGVYQYCRLDEDSQNQLLSGLIVMLNVRHFVPLICVYVVFYFSVRFPPSYFCLTRVYELRGDVAGDKDGGERGVGEHDAVEHAGGGADSAGAGACLTSGE
jgi:hypothetical protein